MADQSIIDLPEALERVAEDRALLLELMQDFVKDFHKKRKLLDQFIESQDFEQLRTTIHFIKGGAGHISFKSMFECCMLIEYLSKQKEADLIKQVMADIDTQFGAFENFVANFK